jgi:hypothetical protein
LSLVSEDLLILDFNSADGLKFLNQLFFLIFFLIQFSLIRFKIPVELGFDRLLPGISALFSEFQP